MARKCKHSRAIFEFQGSVFRKGWYEDALGVPDFGYDNTVIRATCCQCNAKLSLGPSNDDSEAVRVEIRAAEISACVGDSMSPVESRGYGVHPFFEQDHPSFNFDGAHTEPWLAGWLASEIDAVTHGLEEAFDGAHNAWPWDPSRPVSSQYEEHLEALRSFGAVAPTESDQSIMEAVATVFDLAKPEIDGLREDLRQLAERFDGDDPDLQAGGPAMTTAEVYDLWRASEPDCRDEDGPVVEEIMADLLDEPTDPATKFGELAGQVVVPVERVNSELATIGPLATPEESEQVWAWIEGRRGDEP